MPLSMEPHRSGRQPALRRSDLPARPAPFRRRFLWNATCWKMRSSRATPGRPSRSAWIERQEEHMRLYRLLGVLVAVSVIGASLATPRAFATTARQAECAGDYPTDTLQIMAPAAPGGGWDTTAREIQATLQTGVIDQSVEVYNVEGAGGTIGLAQLVADNSGDPNTLMMMGLVMVGAIATNQSEVTLDDVTPVARLTTEWEVIVVPADSEIQTLDDLVAAFQADPGGTTWAGGSQG